MCLSWSIVDVNYNLCGEKERKREKKGEKNKKLAIINNNCYAV
jgi:hypothetical protein